MRGSGADAVPPDVRFAGRPCSDESSALDDVETAPWRSSLKDHATKQLDEKALM